MASLREDHERRLTALETTVDLNNKNLAETMENGFGRLEGYLRRSAEKREEMIGTLGSMKTQLDGFTAYQKKCDDERGKLAKRMGKLEVFQSNQKKLVALIAATVGFLTYGGGKIVEKIGAWFSS